MIALKNISVSFGEKKVLEHFSMEFPEHGILALSGPSGCGKTTIARVLTYLVTPQEGTICGIQPGDAAYLFQEDRLLPWLSVLDNVALVSSNADAASLLASVGLSAEKDSKPGQLSGGMRRRVALARTLSYPSGLIILDEPFTGIDLDAKKTLYPLIRKISERTPVLLITHDKDEITALADSVIYLEEGSGNAES